LLPIVAGVVIAGTIGTGLYFILKDHGTQNDDVTSPLRGLNLSYAPPDAPWEPDEDTAKKVGTYTFVYKRPGIDAWMAFGAKDFGTRAPKPSELVGNLLKPLEKLYENVQEDERPAGATWLGLDAAPVVIYRAQRKEGGEVRAIGYAAHHKGVAYWALFWASPGAFDTHRPEFETVRDRCKLLGLREDWKPKEIEIKTFAGDKGAYQLIDAAGMWAKPKDRTPTDEDEHADLCLVGKEKGGSGTRQPDATLLVLLLDPTGGDPLDMARKYVEEKRTADVRRGDPKLTPTFTDLTGDVVGDPITTDVTPTAKVVRIESKVKGAESQDRLIVLSAMAAGNKVVAVHAVCELRHRALFEPTMVQVAGSLRAK
jgi:hypothetical protein